MPYRLKHRERVAGGARRLAAEQIDAAVETPTDPDTGRQREPEGQARPLGARLDCEKPGAFVRRLAAYWAAWRQERGA